MYRLSDSNDDNERSGPDITDKIFEVSIINISTVNPKTFAQYAHQLPDNWCTKEELNLPGYKLVTEQIKDKELLKLREELWSGKVSHAINSKYILLNNVLYYLLKLTQIQSFGSTYLSI